MFGSEQRKAAEAKITELSKQCAGLFELVVNHQKMIEQLIQLTDKQQAQLNDLYQKTGWPRG